ncbi:DUF1223 domain-containing protein [Mucilaginibacter sp. HD30]
MLKIKKYITGALIVAFVTTVALLTTASRVTTVSEGFAVVELFTSEGCSSCPPADALVAKVQQQYAGKPVYILAYHVDYWNRLGWKDVFSSNEYSQRQRSYAQHLKLQSVYTPQIVVNGKTEFVGSEAGNLYKAIESGLKTIAQPNLALSLVNVKGNSLTVNYKTEVKPGIDLLLALVEKYAQTDVKAGENNGRKLSHVQIVRALHKVNAMADKSGTERFNLPTSIKAKNIEIIGLLQNTVTGEITGAAKAALL